MEGEILFEASWEVCNKVGGIYTVVKSKANAVKKLYGEGYFLIGPYFHNKSQWEFKEKAIPAGLKETADALRERGINCHFGKWIGAGEPNTILIEFSDFAGRGNEIKKELWEAFRIDSLGTKYYDYDQTIIWSYAAGILIGEYAKKYPQKRIIAQFHEWLSGGGLLYLKKNNANVATVFTTHATILGRTIASSGRALYSEIKKISPTDEAYKYGIQAKYLTEKACALNSDVFTTVSEITAMESTVLLGRKPDVVLNNGLNISSFPTFEDTSLKHREFREKLREFAAYYFMPYYTLDVTKTLFFFLAARYEFRDKGIDVFVKALSILNKRLAHEKKAPSIIVFLWVPAGVKGLRQEVIENNANYFDIKEKVDEQILTIKNRIMKSLISADTDKVKDLVEGEDKEEIEERISAFKKSGLPPICTHYLFNEQQDAIINSLLREGLNNKKENKVKVVFYPVYLTGKDNLLNTNYYESIMGCHLGVFPSYYEPWGYTPLETAALAVPSLTTDLSGFGRFIRKLKRDEKNPGIFVLERAKKGDDEFSSELAETLFSFSLLDKNSRVKNKLEAKRLSSKADWSFLIKNYRKAHLKAVKKALLR